MNVTGLLRRLQFNIQVFKIIKQLWRNHGDVFKNWLCPNFLLLPQKTNLPKIWGGAAAPLAPPARTPMLIYGEKFAFQNRLASLIVESKFTVFAMFYFVFEGNFQVLAPGGLIFGRAI